MRARSGAAAMASNSEFVRFEVAASVAAAAVEVKDAPGAVAPDDAAPKAEAAPDAASDAAASPEAAVSVAAAVEAEAAPDAASDAAASPEAAVSVAAAVEAEAAPDAASDAAVALEAAASVAGAVEGLAAPDAASDAAAAPEAAASVHPGNAECPANASLNPRPPRTMHDCSTSRKLTDGVSLGEASQGARDSLGIGIIGGSKDAAGSATAASSCTDGASFKETAQGGRDFKGISEETVVVAGSAPTPSFWSSVAINGPAPLLYRLLSSYTMSCVIFCTAATTSGVKAPTP